MDITANAQTIQLLKDKLNEEETVYQRTDAEQKARLQNINSLRNTIGFLTGEQVVAKIDVNTDKKTEPIPQKQEEQFQYPDKGSWKEKIIAYIKYKNRAITTSQLVKDFEAFETKMTGKQILNLVSGNMSGLVNDGIVKTYKPGKMKGYYYASPKWFDADGNILEEYKPEKKEQTIW